jgi:hypothetical protein
MVTATGCVETLGSFAVPSLKFLLAFRARSDVSVQKEDLKQFHREPAN